MHPDDYAQVLNGPFDPPYVPTPIVLGPRTRLASEIEERDGAIVYVGRDPSTWEVVEIGTLE